MKKCIFAGTFDPPTVGHADMIRQCLRLFDEVVVAVLINPDKQPYFALEEREHMLSLAFSGEPRVRVRSYDGLVVDLMREEGTPFYVRGIRNGADYDLHISSSLVRNSIRFGKPVDEYVPEAARDYIKKLISEKHDQKKH